LPVIASRVSGSEDLIVPGQNGWLFAPGDTAELAAHLREAARMEPATRRKLGLQARGDVAAAADVNVVVDRLVALYRGAATTAPDLPALSIKRS
ncbi:MAG: glycosyltransferase, partial [Vulcanimicrobiaceae bacterium]